MRYFFAEISILDINSEQRRYLRAQAHHLNPVVMIGDAGLSEGVVNEIERSLASHELLKIKVQSGDKAARESLLADICARLDAAPVQHIGKTLVIYKPAEKPKLVLP